MNPCDTHGRVPICITPDARDALNNHLSRPENKGVGFTAFIKRSIERDRMGPRPMTGPALTPEIVHRARQFAQGEHGTQPYRQETEPHLPYIAHLLLAEQVLVRFGVTDPELRAAAILHDVLEDTDATYMDVEIAFGARVAKAVLAVTEPKGGDRKWRHEQAYPVIRENQDAIIVKLADRIANVEAGGKKIGTYVKEHADFYNAVYRADSPPVVSLMWTWLTSLLAQA